MPQTQTLTTAQLNGYLTPEVRQQRAIFRDFGEISSLQINGLGHFLTPN
jgi:hypothetical protein